MKFKTEQTIYPGIKETIICKIVKFNYILGIVLNYDTYTDYFYLPKFKAGGLDKLTLDSLYDDAMRKTQQPTSYNPWEPAPLTNPMMQQPIHDPFFAWNGMVAPHSVQMAVMANQHQVFLLQQQQQMMMTAQQQHLMVVQ